MAKPVVKQINKTKSMKSNSTYYIFVKHEIYKAWIIHNLIYSFPGLMNKKIWINSILFSLKEYFCLWKYGIKKLRFLT